MLQRLTEIVSGVRGNEDLLNRDLELLLMLNYHLCSLAMQCGPRRAAAWTVTVTRPGDRGTGVTVAGTGGAAAADRDSLRLSRTVTSRSG